MEQVLGMIGNTPSRVRKMILRSNAIKRVIMQLIQKPEKRHILALSFAVEAINDLIRQGMNVNEGELFWHAVPLIPINHARARCHGTWFDS